MLNSASYSSSQNPEHIESTDRMQVMLQNQEKWESNARSYPRKNPMVIESAKGVYITDINGKQYLDALAGAGSLALGHNHPHILDAIQSVLSKGRPLHTLDLLTEEKEQFAFELLDTLPIAYQNNTRIQFCGPTGADAVEAAIKLCKTATGRSGIFAFSGAYHGMTQGTMSLMGNINPKKSVENLMPGVQFLPYPYAYRCPFALVGDHSIDIHISYLERLLNDPESGLVKPAAIILEVIQGEGGVIIGPNRWLQAIDRLTKTHDIPLIIDEVQTGIGRTGYMYAFERADIEPDVIVLSKGIGGGLPLSVILYKKHLDIWEPGAHAGTFRGNVLAMATGLATLKSVRKPEFLKKVQTVGDYLKHQLINLQKEFPCLGNVRGCGLMLGIEIVNNKMQPDKLGSFPADAKMAASIKSRCFQKGLIVETGGRFGATLRFLPPLILTVQQSDDLLRCFKEALIEVVSC